VTTLTNYKAIELFGGGGGGADLAATLGIGNTTGGTDIEFSNAGGGFLDQIDSEDNAAGAGYTFNLNGSDAGGGDFDGGDINLNPGSGSGTGADGVVNINGDLVVTGSVTLGNLYSGAGSPETVVTAPIGSLYTRTDGGHGNSQYFKQANGAGNTGWVPAGPQVVENQTAPGGVNVFTTGRAVFDATVVTTVDNLAVFWNGVLQREGIGNDYTVAYGPASATITFSQIPPLNDPITIKYLPE
jgi:hypothetical protein